MRVMIATMFCLGMAGCDMMTTMTPTATVATPTATDDCGAAGAAAFLAQPATSLPAAGTWTTVRVIEPGSMVTQDFSPTRLNARVDAAGNILSLTCG